jgi:hypothetical protein
MVDNVLKERGNQYGSFADNAQVAQSLKRTIKLSKNGYVFPDYIQESLDMICHKIARVCCGNYSHTDNFVDIAGYAQLVVKQLEEEEEKALKEIEMEQNNAPSY